MIKELYVKESGSRIDAFLASGLDGVSRSYASGLIAEGRVKVNDSVIKQSYKVRADDRIEVDIPEPILTGILPEDIQLDIAYEDDYLLVINKPQGMVVHPAPGHHSGTLVNALLHYCKNDLSDINGVIRPGIIHRIDKDTSGLLIVVKNNEIHEKMARMIASHDVVRKYRCLVYGNVQADKGTIDAPIGRSTGDRRRMTVTSSGKPSVTHFEVVERFRKATDLSLVLETGRTHQIRSHMSYIGHPAIGDPMYAGRRSSYGLSGQALHSKELSFIHPVTGENIFVQSELPSYYLDLIEVLRNETGR
jgi:23S rRNA pseudouridine1911/1915/1917 synthase